MEIIYFIKWCIKRIVDTVSSWDNWQYAWCATWFLGGGIIASDPGGFVNKLYTLLLSLLFVFYWVGYQLIYKTIQKAWIAYQEEKQKVLDALKDASDAT